MVCFYPHRFSDRVGSFSQFVYLPFRYLIKIFQLFSHLRFSLMHCQKLHSPWLCRSQCSFSSVFFSFFSLLFFCCFSDDLFQRFHFPIHNLFPDSCLFINLSMRCSCYKFIEIIHHVFRVIHSCVEICS